MAFTCQTVSARKLLEESLLFRKILCDDDSWRISVVGEGYLDWFNLAVVTSRRPFAFTVLCWDFIIPTRPLSPGAPFLSLFEIEPWEKTISLFSPSNSLHKEPGKTYLPPSILDPESDLYRNQEDTLVKGGKTTRSSSHFRAIHSSSWSLRVRYFFTYFTSPVSFSVSLTPAHLALHDTASLLSVENIHCQEPKHKVIVLFPKTHSPTGFTFLREMQSYPAPFTAPDSVWETYSLLLYTPLPTIQAYILLP